MNVIDLFCGCGGLSYGFEKEEKKLYILQDPVRLYKNDLIDMSIKDGAEITFYPQKSGNYEELLVWTN